MPICSQYGTTVESHHWRSCSGRGCAMWGGPLSSWMTGIPFMGAWMEGARSGGGWGGGGEVGSVSRDTVGVCLISLRWSGLLSLGYSTATALVLIPVVA